MPPEAPPGELHLAPPPFQPLWRATLLMVLARLLAGQLLFCLLLDLGVVREESGDFGMAVKGRRWTVGTGTR